MGPFGELTTSGALQGHTIEKRNQFCLSDVVTNGRKGTAVSLGQLHPSPYTQRHVRKQDMDPPMLQWLQAHKSFKLQIASLSLPLVGHLMTTSPRGHPCLPTESAALQRCLLELQFTALALWKPADPSDLICPGKHNCQQHGWAHQ